MRRLLTELKSADHGAFSLLLSELSRATTSSSQRPLSLASLLQMRRNAFNASERRHLEMSPRGESNNFSTRTFTKNLNTIYKLTWGERKSRQYYDSWYTLDASCDHPACICGIFGQVLVRNASDEGTEREEELDGANTKTSKKSWANL